MNRAEFMRQLESLLQNIPVAEREEALQYYNDYFDDAGDENEQDVIEALGNPARVAENIKHDLLESGYGETPLKKASASDRKLIEYGTAEPQQAQANPGAQEPPETGHRSQEGRNAGSSGNGPAGGYGSGPAGGTGMAGSRGIGTNSGYVPGMNNGSGMSGGNAGSYGTGYAYAGGAVPADAGQFRQSGKSGRTGWPGWAIALLVVGLIAASPVITGVIGTLAGVIVAWFAVIFAIGMVTAALFLVFVVLAVVGIMCMFTDPVSGVALVGGGLLCAGIGVLFLMLTVAMAGIVTPAIFHGIAFLFRRLKKR